MVWAINLIRFISILAIFRDAVLGYGCSVVSGWFSLIAPIMFLKCGLEEFVGHNYKYFTALVRDVNAGHQKTCLVSLVSGLLTCWSI